MILFEFIIGFFLITGSLYLYNVFVNYKKSCYKCRNRVETSEAELYYMTDGYSSGSSIDWCKEYDLPIRDRLIRDPKLKKCIDFEGDVDENN